MKLNRKTTFHGARILAASLIAGMTLHAATAQAANSHLQQILESGELRVGLQGAFKPWSFPSPDGALQGIEVDLAKSVAETLGVKLTPVAITSANRMQFLQQGKIDLIIGGMYDTAERRKIIGIIEPAYWSSGPTLMAKKGVINDWKDIEGKPVCSKQGVLYSKQVETRFRAKIIAFAGNTEGKEALRSGKCVAWLYDDVSIMADLATDQWQGYEMPVEALYDNPWAAAVPLGDENESWKVFMKGMAYQWQASGELLKLSEKWDVKPSDWLANQHEKAKWDDSYVQ